MDQIKTLPELSKTIQETVTSGEITMLTQQSTERLTILISEAQKELNRRASNKE